MGGVEHEEQPMPVATDGPHIHDLVVADVRDSGLSRALQVALDVARRKQVGVARYGQPLQAHNGRDALRDAYEEVLDLLVYLKQYQQECGARVGVYDEAIGLACSLAALVQSRVPEGNS